MTAVQPAITRGFLFADLRDYTRFAETHGDEAAAALLTAYRALIRDVLARLGGAEIRTEGDSFYVVFASASGAVHGGLAILAAAAEANAQEPARPIRVAIGVHAGETAETGEGPVGSAVNIAARVCAQAHAGELLVTDTVRSLTRTRLEVRFVARGSRHLKGIAEPITLYLVETDEKPSSVGPFSRSTRRWLLPAAAAAGALVVVVAGLALIQGGGSTPPQSPGASLAASPLRRACSSRPGGALPTVADVPFYRADAERSSIYPGPGPVCEPELAWWQQLAAPAVFVPIVIDGQVIVGDGAGLHAFDARSGRTTWDFDEAPGGFQESAAAADGSVFAAGLDGMLYALDSHTGARKWTASLPNNGVTRPLVAVGTVWAGSSDGHAYGFDPSSGTRRWTWDGPPDTQINVAFVTEDTVYVTAGGTMYAVWLESRAERWRQPIGMTVRGPALAGDTIYIAAGPGEDTSNRGALFALDRATGMNRWTPPFAIASGLHVTPGPVPVVRTLQSGGGAVDEKVIYVTTNGDGVYKLQDNGDTYHVASHNPDIGWSTRTASLVGDILYVQPTEAALVALDAEDLTKLWETPTESKGTENPVVTGGMVYQVDNESNVLRAWAEPGLMALVASPLAPATATPSPSMPVDPFEVTATYPWFQTGIQDPAAMAMGPDGLLYVLHAKADYSNPMVTVIDPTTGQPTGTQWGRFGSGKGEFDLTNVNGNGPGGCITVAPDGLVYVGERANHRVEVFKPDGTFVRQIGGPVTLGAVIICALGTDGSLFTVDDGTGVLSKFSPRGKFLWGVRMDPEHPGLAGQLHGIAVRPDGKIVGFIELGRAVVLDPASGKVLSSWGTPGGLPGQLGGSGEPSLDAAGNLYVYQYVPQAVQVFDPTGRFLAGRHEDALNQLQWLGPVFWPPPVFAKDGSAYTFGEDGLERLEVTLPAR